MISCFADEISPLLYEQLDMLDELSIPALDIRSVWNINVLEMTELQLREIAHTIKAYGKVVSCISTPIGKCPWDAPTLMCESQLETAVNAAKICGADRIRVFSWQLGSTKRTPEVFAEAAERLERLASAAESAGITLVLENSAAGVGNTGENCARLIRETGSSNIKLAFDPASFISAGENPYDDSYPPVKELIGCVHIKDIKRGTPGRCVAGVGDGQLPQLVKAFSVNPDLYLTLEPHMAFHGEAGGFSGPGNFRKAYFALKALL